MNFLQAFQKSRDKNGNISPASIRTEIEFCILENKDPDIIHKYLYAE